MKKLIYSVSLLMLTCSQVCVSALEQSSGDVANTKSHLIRPPTVARNGALTGFLDTMNPDRMVFYVGSDQHVHDLEWSNNGAGWQTFDLSVLTGGVNVANGGSLTSFLDTMNPDRMVFYVGSDQHVHDLEWSNNGAGWHNFDLSALTGGVNVANGGSLTSFLDTMNPDRMVFYVGSDQRVHDLEWSNNGTGWHTFRIM